MNNINKPIISDFGKIMQDMYQIAYSSENHTWFLEKEWFEDSEYTLADLEELKKDISILYHEYNIKDIECIIEVYDCEEPCMDAVAIFHGAFLKIFKKV